MIETSARRSTAFLLFAALQFVVATAIAIQLYPNYRFADQFLSELGATRTWYGVPNDAAAVIFAIAVAILGAALIVFSASWRDYAYGKRRARALGGVSQICGTLSGIGFVGVAFTPIDVALDAHNLLVIVAYGLLLAFATTMTLLWWRNGAPVGAIVAGILYFVLLVTFFASAGWAIATDLRANIGVLIIGQKIAAAGSMAYVAYVTLMIRRQLGAAVESTRR